MVRAPADTDDPDDADAPSWPFSLVIVHGGIVVALWYIAQAGSDTRVPRQRQRAP